MPKTTTRTKPAKKPKPRSATRSNPIDAYVERLDFFDQELVREIVDIVREAAPQARELIRWDHPVWAHKGLLCYVRATQTHVTFGLLRGGELKDPQKLLEGSGPGLRLLKLSSLADVRRKTFLGWVKQSVKLNEADPRPE